MHRHERTKKTFQIASKICTWLILACTVFMLVFTIVTVSTVNKNEKSLFGRKFYIVQTDSMSKSENNKDLKIHFNAGDIVIIKEVNPTKLEVGDVISFISTNSASYGEVITHRIREVQTDENGKVLGYVTYGTHTGVNDEKIVEPDFVLGKYSGKLPKLGNFFAFLKTTSGYIVCILVPFLLLILYNGVNVIRLYKRYKKEQTAILEAEKAKIAEDKRQTEEMLKELQALKEQLGIDTEDTALH